MKKYFTLLLVAMAILATSCNKQNVNEPDQLVAGEGQFLATIAENSAQNAPSFSGADNSTQAAFGSDGLSVMWQVQDVISVNGIDFTCNSQPQTNKAIFENQNAPTMTGPYEAYYPASVANGLPSSWTYDAAHNANMLPMYAESETRTLEFHNLCAALKITLPANFSASKIEISNLDKAINGAFTVTDNVAVMHTDNVTDDEKKITITGPFTGGEVIYAPMPEGTYTNFTVRMLDAQDNQTWIKIIPTLTVVANKIYNVRIDKDDYFCFTALAASTVSFTESDLLKYSTDNGTSWTDYIAGTSIQLAQGAKVYFKAKQSQQSLGYVGGYFSGTGSLKVSGNIMYLLDPNGTLSNFTSANMFALQGLFYEMTTLTDASQLCLPAETLAMSCYEQMFYGCSSLTTAPALPAETLDRSCYEGMFSGCSSLTTAPALPAETLARFCYSNMFSGCSSLTTAPALPAETLDYHCYEGMFYGCSGLTTAPELPAETLALACYWGMFEGCSSLTIAPELPAKTLPQDCYSAMFANCSRLNSVTMKATSIGEESLKNWLKDAGTQASSRTVDCDNDVINTVISNTPLTWTVVGHDW